MDALPSAGSSLREWGWDEAWRAAFEPYAAAGLVPARLVPARVVAQHRGRWLVAGDGFESPAEPTGRLRRAADDGADLPVVGDWVGCERTAGGTTRLEVVVARRSAFRRRAAGSNVASQVIAANIDTLLIATSLNHDLNAGRLERYVAMALESGCEPVVLLTKADLADDAAGVAGGLASRLGVVVATVSSVSGTGVDALVRWLQPGRTIALVGSSGVGKSTLLNRIAGAPIQRTLGVRAGDDRGRHSTTHRELFMVPGGALVLDTPGLRELGIWAATEGVESTFAEIADLAGQCRFSDCRHEREPGCAVTSALASGEIDARRLRSYRRLAQEAADTSPAARREAERRFSRMVRDISANTLARKTYGGGAAPSRKHPA